VFIYWLGHGGHDRDETRMVSRVLSNGMTVVDHPHFPKDSPNWWMRFPKSDSQGNRLYAKDLEIVFNSLCSARGNGPPKLKRVVIFLGACFSGGMVQSWLPNSNLPILAITSSDSIGRVGTWAWHEFLRHLRTPNCAKRTFHSIFNQIKTANPSISYDVEDARGEPNDSILCQIFAGNNSDWEQLQLKDFFGSKPYLSQLQIVTIMSSFRTSDLSYDHYPRTLASIQNPEESKTFLNDLLTHGFALLDIGDENYKEKVTPMWKDLKTFMESSEEEKFKCFSVSIGPNHDDCGYAVDPGNMEQWKFVHSGLCQANQDSHYPWPQNPPTFRHNAIQYYEYARNLAAYIAGLLADYIGKENGGLKEEWEKLMDPTPMPLDFFSNGDCRFFRYLANSNMSAKSFVGEIHVDIGMISLGPLSSVAGIQFLDRKDLVWRVPERNPSYSGKPLLAFGWVIF
jgi:hypothetical protein